MRSQGTMFLKNTYSVEAEAKAKGKRKSTVDYGMNFGEDRSVHVYSWAKLSVAETIHQLLNNLLILGLNTYVVILGKSSASSDDMMLYPHPFARKKVLEDPTITLVQLLLLSSDTGVLRATHEFIQAAYLNKYSYRFLVENSNFLELVFLRLNSDFAAIAIYNIRKLFLTMESEMSADDKAKFKDYNSFSFAEDTSYLETSISQYFPISRLLPKFFIQVLLVKGEDAFNKIFFGDEHFTADSLWNSKMRRELTDSLEIFFSEDISELESQLKSLHEPTSEMSIGNMHWYMFKPQRKPSLKVVYREFENSLRCGPIFLKPWIKDSFRNYKMPEEIVGQFIENLYGYLRTMVGSVACQGNFTENVRSLDKTYSLWVVLKSHVKMIRTFIIPEYDCYESLDTVLEMWIAIDENNLLGLGGESSTIKIENSVMLTNNWDENVIAVFEIIISSMITHEKEPMPTNIKTFAGKQGIKNSLLKVASIIVDRYFTAATITINHMLILKYLFIVCTHFNFCYQHKKILSQELLDLFRLEPS
jgi:hypothetical protein